MRIKCATVAPASRLSLGRLFKRHDLIEELPELRSIQAVQNLVAKVCANPVPRLLSKNESYYQWINLNFSRIQLTHLDKEAFDALVKDVRTYLQMLENEAFQKCGNIGPMEPNSDSADALVEAIKSKLARHMFTQAVSSFELLDKDQDGKVHVQEIQKLLQVIVRGNRTQWMKNQFNLYDTDGDHVVSEAESNLILGSIIKTQKDVMTETFGTHVNHLPKTHARLFTKSLVEEEFKSQIPEKVRCVFHFAKKVDKECRTIDFEQFEISQKAEFPELHNLLSVFSKGFYDERYIYHKCNQEKQSMRYKGLALAAVIGLGDYITAVI